MLGIDLEEGTTAMKKVIIMVIEKVTGRLTLNHVVMVETITVIKWISQPLTGWTGWVLAKVGQ